MVLPPGDDRRFREVLFGDGNGLLDFYTDEPAGIIRIFNLVWIG